MKKITLFLFTFIAGITLNAQITLTHSTDPITIDGGVTCSNDVSSGLNAYRSFILTDFGVTNDFQVASVEFAANALTGLTGDYPVTLIISTTDAPFPTGTLTEIASTIVNLTIDDVGILQSVPLDALVPAGSELVFTVMFPDDGVTINSIGSNAGGQTAPSWADGTCVADITDIADFDLDNSWVLNVIGDEVLGLNDNVLADNISLYPNPTNSDLNINFARNFGATNIAVINVNGQKVMSASVDGIGNNTLATSKLANGIYFAQVTNQEGTATIKFIKN